MNLRYFLFLIAISGFCIGSQNAETPSVLATPQSNNSTVLATPSSPSTPPNSTNKKIIRSLDDKAREAVHSGIYGAGVGTISGTLIWNFSLIINKPISRINIADAGAVGCLLGIAKAIISNLRS